MIDQLLYLLLYIATIVVAFPVIDYLFAKKDQLGIEGKLIWTDEGHKTKPFFNNVYDVLGKPDLMYKIKGGILAVEYKSRHGKIYESDIVQTRCASLAARGSGYKVIKFLVITGTRKQYFDLPRSDKALYKEIEPYVVYTRQSKIGCKLPATPGRFNCKSCAFNYKCNYVQD
jgi:CRISPR/Cas system-associated exonuclease Cas4 (RecB family)